MRPLHVCKSLRCNARIRVILSDVATSRWMREGASADVRAHALVQTLANDGADVVKIEELSWSPPTESLGGLRTAVIFDAHL